MMTLSEAIRLGATLKPQTHGHFHTPAGRRTCALGAAIEALGLKATPSPNGTASNRVTGELQECSMSYRWPEEWWAIVNILVPCPVCSDVRYLLLMIPHLNDEHRWTREQIAEFVQNVEKAQPQPQASETITA